MVPEISKEISWPANRTDGHHNGPALTMGQMFRLPANLDIDLLGLSPATTTIAKAVQEYGIILTDTAGSVTFQAENPLGLKSNNYDDIFNGQAPYERTERRKSLQDPVKSRWGIPRHDERR